MKTSTTLRNGSITMERVTTAAPDWKKEGIMYTDLLPASFFSWLLNLLALLTLPIASAHDIVPGSLKDQAIALINGTVHPVSSETIQNGSVLLQDGKIVAVGDKFDLPEAAQVIDLQGKHVYPGLISSLSSLGLVEINAVRATRDLAEPGKLNPNARAEAAVNPDSELIPVTRANGVLVAHVSPMTSGGGLIAGSTAAMYLDGWTYEDMTVAAPVGISMSWPQTPRDPAFNLNRRIVHDPQKGEENYSEQIDALEDAFRSARSYLKAKLAEPINVDLRWEALDPVLEKKIPVLVKANSVREIRDAVAWANRENIHIVITGGRDAWRATETLKEKEVSVVLGPIQALPRRRWEPYDSAFTNAAKLSEAGVEFAIAYGGGGPVSSNERNLPYEAGKAVAHGLSQEEALKAITLYPARILGIDDRLGSIEEGKDATLIVTTGDPLDIRTNVEMAFIQGRSVDLSSRHTQLYEKYKKKYEQMR